MGDIQQQCKWGEKFQNWFGEKNWKICVENQKDGKTRSKILGCVWVGGGDPKLVVLSRSDFAVAGGWMGG